MGKNVVAPMRADNSNVTQAQQKRQEKEQQQQETHDHLETKRAEIRKQREGKKPRGKMSATERRASVASPEVVEEFRFAVLQLYETAEKAFAEFCKKANPKKEGDIDMMTMGGISFVSCVHILATKRHIHSHQH